MDNKLLFYLNENQTAGFGFQEKEPKGVVNVNIEYLKKAVELLENANIKTFDVCFFGEDEPLLIGIKSKPKLYTGVLIAPRIKFEENETRYERR